MNNLEEVLSALSIAKSNRLALDAEIDNLLSLQRKFEEEEKISELKEVAENLYYATRINTFDWDKEYPEDPQEDDFNKNCWHGSVHKLFLTFAQRITTELGKRYKLSVREVSDILYTIDDVVGKGRQ